MVGFVNAKINIGLNVVARREDGYHELESVFYPIGIFNGTPENPEPFCDILEIIPSEKDEFIFTGNPIDCPLEKNLVFKALQSFRNELKLKHPGQIPTCVRVKLAKHIPDGAGMGGGSADATFTLKMLSRIAGEPFQDRELKEMAKRLGADCPFFIENKPAYVTGIGEKTEPVENVLAGYWAVVAKPDVYVSTKEAFAGIVPKPAVEDLRETIKLPVALWKEAGIKNDFERCIFAKHPELEILKETLYETGALYASMSGSGSSIYGLFPEKTTAERVYLELKKGEAEGMRSYLCKL